jgi:hypothetical protein
MKQKEIDSVFECLDIAEECTGDGTGIQLARRLIGMTLGIKPSAKSSADDDEAEGQGGVEPLTEKQQEALDILKQLQSDDGELTVKGLAEGMETSEANANILLAGLFAKGAVTREKSGHAYIYTPKAA